MEKIKVFDFLNLSLDKDFLKMIDEEKIYYSESVVKIKHLGKNRERNFIITNKYAYFFKKKNLKKKVSLTSILGLSYSTISNELIIHLKTEEDDYWFMTENKIIIIYIIVLLYQELDDKIMPIYEIREKSLKNFMIYEKDKKKNRFYSKNNLAYQINTKSFLEANKQNIEKAKNEMDKYYNNNINTMIINDYQDLNNMENKIKIEDFKIIKEIKRISYGNVFITKYLIDNKIYLLKSINKIFITNNLLIEQKILEKYILQKLEYPFIDKMIFCFQNEENIFFGFNYIKTDNLYNQLCLCRHFPEETVKFYASIIGLTLEYLHKNSFIYRDFNLKYISINEEGYLLFSNFHNVKVIEENDETDIKFRGVVEYFPPEVIIGDRHSEVSDWWCFGIIIYEMFFGVPPFLSSNTNELYNMILSEEIKFPKNNNISAEAKDLLQKLLIKEKHDRLGFEGGFEVIKNHYFFKGVDFANLEKKQITSPYKPKINDEIDENFNVFNNIDFNSKNISEIYLDFLKKNQNMFNEFLE
jgi:hypothetical protein